MQPAGLNIIPLTTVYTRNILIAYVYTVYIRRYIVWIVSVPLELRINCL